MNPREEKRLRVVFLAHYAAETGRSRQNTGPWPPFSTMPASDSRPAGLCVTFDDCVNIERQDGQFIKAANVINSNTVGVVSINRSLR